MRQTIPNKAVLAVFPELENGSALCWRLANE